MVSLRRLTVLAGLAISGFQKLVTPDEIALAPVVAGGLAIWLYNEIARWLLLRVREERLPAVVNAPIVLDTVVLVTLLHYAGGLTSLGVMFFAPAFFAYGAVLPLEKAFVHVGLATLELAALGVAERSAILPHLASSFYGPSSHLEPTFIALVVAAVGTISALSAYLSHYLAALLGEQDEKSRVLASERGDLLLRNEREATRVRALLEVAQHVSGTHTVEALFRAVCETTVALVRVPRVEVFVWDAERKGLRLVAARGLAEQPASGDDVRYPAELPIVARLRAGEVVQFGAAPSMILVPGRVAPPFRKGFAAPMVCRGSFEGALFVGYDEENADELMELVQGIARQAALALVNVRTIEQQQEDAEVSRVLLDLSQGLSACLDEDALWKLLVHGASEVLDLPWSVATRFDERGGTFSIAGAHGLPEEEIARLSGRRLDLDAFPVLRDAIARRELLIADGTSTAPLGIPAGWHPGSWIGIPLFRSGWVAGFLTVGLRHGRRPFSRRQLRLAEGLGHHASIALQNARLVADLEAADHLKSEFVSTMSHELRTPLNVIIGYTEMLREGAVGPVTSGQRELIDRLDARGRELLELIEATLHVGRLEAGRDMVEIAAVALADLMQALHASTAGLPRSPAIAFEWETPENLGERIMTDRAKVALVVRNLVSNAFKFTSEGRVVVRVRVQQEALVIEVEDTGIGIGAEHLPIIFEMFRQVDGSMTRRHGGVGLGLYIVKQFVTRLGGTVDVTSTPGRGSQFRVVLPGVLGDERRSAA
jgi:signal transduction histidine kinase